MAEPGLFISFECGDWAGKSTQIRILAERLKAAGRDVVLTREPGGADGAEAIRGLLVTGDKDRWSPISEALLMYAARRDHLEKTILPALARGAVVITDRFADSSMAYQGVAGAAGVAAVRALHDIVVSRDPDVTFILDADPARGLARATTEDGETRFEEKGLAFQEAVRQAFLDIAAAEPQRCVLIDAGGEIDAIAARIAAALKTRLPGLLPD